MYLHTGVHIYTFMYIYIYIHTQIYIYIYIYIYTHTHTHTRTQRLWYIHNKKKSGNTQCILLFIVIIHYFH